MQAIYFKILERTSEFISLKMYTLCGIVSVEVERGDRGHCPEKGEVSQGIKKDPDGPDRDPEGFQRLPRLRALPMCSCSLLR